MTNGEAAINRAIEALEEAIAAGDEVEEVFIDSDADWRTVAAGLEKCIEALTAKSAKELATATWG